MERSVRKGVAAWHRGDLENANEHLRAALGGAGDCIEALLPLARVTSELGDAEEALELLARAEATPSASESARVYRALVLYDHGRFEESAEIAREFAKANPLAAAVLQLVELGANATRSQAELPLEARWLADVSGRYVALLEERLHQRNPDGVTEFHHRFLEPGATPAAANPAEAKPPANEKEWQARIEKHFTEKAFEDLCRVYEANDVDDRWRDLNAQLNYAFASTAISKADRAEALMASQVPAHGRDPLVHLIRGLAQIRLGQSTGAAWSFVRVARRADITVDNLVRALEEELSR